MIGEIKVARCRSSSSLDYLYRGETFFSADAALPKLWQAYDDDDVDYEESISKLYWLDF